MLMFEWSILKTVDFVRGAWQLALKKKEVLSTSTLLESALKKDLFIFTFDAFFCAFFRGSCSCSSIETSQFAIMAAVSESRQRCCVCSEDTDSRRAADGFRVRLEDLGSGLAVYCTKAGRITGCGEG